MSTLYIGLTLPDELARRFPHDAQRGDPHVTVLYCAEIEASPDDIMSAITSAVDGVGPVPVTLSDDVIQLGPDDAPVAAATLADDLRLRLLRLAIRAELTARDIDHPQSHPEFVPHATIRGLAEGEAIDSVKAPAGECSIGVLTVRIDDVEHLVAMGPARASLTSGVGAIRAELRALRFGDDLDGEAAARMAAIDLESLPDGWIVGRPFRCLAAGAIYQRVESARTGAGQMRGQPISRDHLASIARAFEAGEEVPINREHNRATPEGTVLAAWLVDGGEALAVLPAYTPAMASYVAKSSGCLWSSPEIAWGDTHDPATGAVLGSMLMDGLALTAHPAQKHSKIDRVRLGAEPATERAEMATDEESPQMDEEIKQFMATVMATLDEMKAEIAALKGDADNDDGGTDGTDDSGTTPPQPEQGDDEEMSKLRAENAALKAKAEKMAAEKLSAERGAAVRELLTSGRITPAEKAKAERLVETGGVELLSAIYGDRKAGHAIPKLKGHAQPVEPPAGEGGDEWAQADKAARELMSADAELSYDVALGRVIAKNQREKLTAR